MSLLSILVPLHYFPLSFRFYRVRHSSLEKAQEIHIPPLSSTHVMPFVAPQIQTTHTHFQPSYKPISPCPSQKPPTKAAGTFSSRPCTSHHHFFPSLNRILSLQTQIHCARHRKDCKSSRLSGKLGTG
jgi:hypothetical protein